MALIESLSSLCYNEVLSFLVKIFSYNLLECIDVCVDFECGRVLMVIMERSGLLKVRVMQKTS